MQKTTAYGMYAPNEKFYDETPTPKAQGTLDKTSWKDCKSQMTEWSTVRYYFQYMRGGYTHEIFALGLSKEVDMSV